MLSCTCDAARSFAMNSAFSRDGGVTMLLLLASLFLGHDENGNIAHRCSRDVCAEPGR
jgi:hypothetical protein